MLRWPSIRRSSLSGCATPPGLPVGADSCNPGAGPRVGYPTEVASLNWFAEHEVASTEATAGVPRIVNLCPPGAQVGSRHQPIILPRVLSLSFRRL